MLISTAYAQGATTASPESIMTGLWPILLVFGVFYFLFIRPQNKRIKEHQELVNGLRRGDKVVTNGGLIGVVTKLVDDNVIRLEIADGVDVKIHKNAVQDLVDKGAPVTEEKPAKKPSVKKKSAAKTTAKK